MCTRYGMLNYRQDKNIKKVIHKALTINIFDLLLPSFY
jgi:hypothetical protein